MIETRRGYGGAVIAPHHAAAEAGAEILREGGNALEAMIAAAATISVVYPHMNGLGGDSFWLIHFPGTLTPIAVQACGAAASLATPDWYVGQELDSIPARGAGSALTVAGAVSGWEAAFRISRERRGGRHSMRRLLADAKMRATDGFAVTRSQARATAAKYEELENVPGYTETFAPNSSIPTVGQRFRQERLAGTLDRLSQSGLADFYHGDVARSIARDLETLGSPLRLIDLERHEAKLVDPLSVEVSGHKLFNLPPPTQGLASLLLLGMYDRIRADVADGFDYVHRLVECTKQAFSIRDRYVTDPNYMTIPAGTFLRDSVFEELVNAVDLHHSAPWSNDGGHGDTVWLGACDRDGCMVSFIQSIYWEFGSGVVLPETGVTWQNRGTSFSLEKGHLNELRPGRFPFHTI